MSSISSVIVCYDPPTETSFPVLVVGKKLPNKSIDIINAISGDEATELWNRLITSTSEEKKDEQD